MYGRAQVASPSVSSLIDWRCLEKSWPTPLNERSTAAEEAGTPIVPVLPFLLKDVDQSLRALEVLHRLPCVLVGGVALPSNVVLGAITPLAPLGLDRPDFERVRSCSLGRRVGYPLCAGPTHVTMRNSTIDQEKFQQLELSERGHLSVSCGVLCEALFLHDCMVSPVHIWVVRDRRPIWAEVAIQHDAWNQSCWRTQEQFQVAV